MLEKNKARQAAGKRGVELESEDLRRRGLEVGGKGVVQAEAQLCGRWGQ